MKETQVQNKRILFKFLPAALLLASCGPNQGSDEIRTFPSPGSSAISGNSFNSNLQLQSVGSAPSYRPNVFVIGVWGQPHLSFSKWQDLGVNTVFGYDSESGTSSFDQFLYFTQHPGGSLEPNRPALQVVTQFPAASNISSYLSVSQNYPNLIGILNSASSGSSTAYINYETAGVLDPQALLSSYQSLHSKLNGTAWANLPVVSIFNGASLLNSSLGTTSFYQSAALAGDWIGSDLYPITAIANTSTTDSRDNIDLSKAGAKINESLALDSLNQLSAGRFQLAMIECSNQKLGSLPDSLQKEPSTDEVRGEVWDAIIHGARSIVYNPLEMGRATASANGPQVSFQFDASSAAMKTEMKNINDMINSKSAILLADGSQFLGMPAPFEAAKRSFQGINYTIVLNFSHQAANYVNTGASFDSCFAGKVFQAFEVAFCQN